MATAFETPISTSRPRWTVQRYEEQPSTFGRCDCTSYSYLALSVVLFTVGTAITIFALPDVANGHILSNLGEMWLIGPMFICSGLMVAVKCMLYLRRKSVIQLIFHQRQLFRELAAGRSISNAGSGSMRPPSYEVIVQGPCTNQEAPPPSYTEAISLLHSSARTAASDTKADSKTVSCGSGSLVEKHTT